MKPVLPNDVARCADGLHCPERKTCARWVLRMPAGVNTVWSAFFAEWTDQGCQHRIEREHVEHR